jgi:glycogen operon protein
LTAKGEPQPDDSFYLILNAHFENIDWVLPAISAGDRWRLLMDTAMDGNLVGSFYEDGSIYPAMPRSIAVLMRYQDQDEAPRTGILA